MSLKEYTITHKHKQFTHLLLYSKNINKTFTQLKHFDVISQALKKVKSKINFSERYVDAQNRLT